MYPRHVHDPRQAPQAVDLTPPVLLQRVQGEAHAAAMHSAVELMDLATSAAASMIADTAAAEPEEARPHASAPAPLQPGHFSCVDGRHVTCCHT